MRVSQIEKSARNSRNGLGADNRSVKIRLNTGRCGEMRFRARWIVQRRRNTSVGIVIHGVFNAAGFVAVASGAGS